MIVFFALWVTAFAVMNFYHGPGLVNPSYEELEQFLINDDTNNRLYSENFTCVDFSYMLVRNAVRKGWMACPVWIKFYGGMSHTIVGFKTDAGIVYVEPQLDIFVDLQVNKSYSKLLNIPESKILTRPENDTIAVWHDCWY